MFKFSGKSDEKPKVHEEHKEDREEENRLIEAGIAEILKNNAPEKTTEKGSSKSEKSTEMSSSKTDETTEQSLMKPDNSKLLKAGFDEAEEGGLKDGKNKGIDEKSGDDKQQQPTPAVTVSLKGTGKKVTVLGEAIKSYNAFSLVFVFL